MIYSFEDFQSEFRVNHSRETALVNVKKDLLIASHKGLSIFVLLDLSAAFDTIDHHILLQRLEHFIGIKGFALSWVKSYLSDRFHFVSMNDKSIYSKVSHEFPLDSVRGQVLFTIYMLPLGNIIRKYCINVHCYVDETDQLAKLQACVRDMKIWMTSNFILFNSDKTEVNLLCRKQLGNR